MNFHRPAPGSRWLILLLFIIVATLGAWASLSELDQIARAQGQVIATSRTCARRGSEWAYRCRAILCGVWLRGWFCPRV